MCEQTEPKPVDKDEPKKYISAAEERVLIRAARLKISVDAKLGTVTPSWVYEIAKRPL